MQLLLGIDNNAAFLADIDRRLRSHFGRRNGASSRAPVSQFVKSFLGARTRGPLSKAAMEALLKRFDSWENVRDALVNDIYSVIRQVTFAEIKAPRLKAALIRISEINGGLTLDPLRNMSVGDALLWLEGLPGVGRKVSASTLNASALNMRALVIDTHHLRVLRRLGLVSMSSDIRQAYALIMPMLPARWSAAEFNEHHQLVKRLGQEYCRHAAPKCALCPLNDLCRSNPQRSKQKISYQDQYGNSAQYQHNISRRHSIPPHI